MMKSTQLHNHQHLSGISIFRSLRLSQNVHFQNGLHTLDYWDRLKTLVIISRWMTILQWIFVTYTLYSVLGSKTLQCYKVFMRKCWYNVKGQKMYYPQLEKLNVAPSITHNQKRKKHISITSCLNTDIFQLLTILVTLILGFII